MKVTTKINKSKREFQYWHISKEKVKSEYFTWEERGLKGSPPPPYETFPETFHFVIDGFKICVRTL